MQDPRSNSTLELVVNEQQLQNMSQIDLSRPNENNQQQNSNDNQRSTQQSNSFSFKQLKEWPTIFKANFTAKIDEAKAKSSTNTEFALELLQAFSGTLIWILCFICTIILPIFLFFIGLANLDNCKDRPALPYLVFATGFVMSASNLFNLGLALDLPILTNHEILTNDIKNTIASILNMIFNCVVAFLYILSAYMVYTIDTGKTSDETHSPTISTMVSDSNVAIESINNSETNNNSGTNNPLADERHHKEETEITQIMNCGGLLYHSTFWFITLTLGLFAVLSLVACVLYCYNKYRLAIIRGSTPRSQTNNTNTTNINVNTIPTGFPANGV